MRLNIVLSFIFFFFYLQTFSQCPELEILNLKRTALILGEKSYQYANPLKNPSNDALDIADSLKKIGFDVSVYIDSDLKMMNAVVDQWCSKLSNYNVALFYYSGHGAELNSENYLFPIDANPKSSNEMSNMCFSANKLLSRIDNSNVRFNIMILDACRSNPFSKSWIRDLSSGGLAAMTGKGTFIGYAAEPGSTASDGTGRNGTYTEAILKYIATPGLTIDQVFTKVNSYVRNATNEKQIPFKNSSLSSDYCFSVKRVQQLNVIQHQFFMQPPSEVLLTNDQSLLININDSGIYIKDALTLNNLQFIKTSNSKLFKIASKKNDYVIAIDSINKKLFKIDVRRKIISAVIKLQYTPTSIAITNSEDKAYISFKNSNYGGIYAIDLIKIIITKIPILNISPIAITLSSDNKYLFILSSLNKDTGSIIVLNTNTYKETKQIKGINGGKSIGLSPDDKTLLISTQKDNLGQTVILDATSLKVKKTLELQTDFFAYTLDNSMALAINEKELYIIGLKHLSIINRIPFNSNIKGIAISTDGIANIWLPSENRFYIYKIEQMLNKNIIDPELKLKEFKELAQKDYLDERLEYNKTKLIFDTLASDYVAAVVEVKNDLGDAYNVTRRSLIRVITEGEIIGFHPKEKMFGEKYGIFTFNDKKSINTHYIGKLSSDELILEIHEEPSHGHAPEIFRTSLTQINWSNLKAFVRKYFLMRLDQLRE